MPGTKLSDIVLRYVSRHVRESVLRSLWNRLRLATVQQSCTYCGRTIHPFTFFVSSGRAAICIDCWLGKYPEDIYEILYIALSKNYNTYSRLCREAVLYLLMESSSKVRDLVRRLLSNIREVGLS